MTNFQPRSINTVQNQLYRFLSGSNSPLTDTSQGSVLSALTRAIAAFAIEQDYRINEFSEAFYIETAVGVQLDNLAANFEVSRRPPEPSQGYILLTSDARSQDVIEVLPGEVFTNLSNGLQVTTTNTSTLRISPLVEQVVPVISTTTGFSANFQEGTRLSSENSNLLEAVVGSHRTSAGEACGSLSGGRDQESDLEFKIRLINFILSRRGTTEGAIRSVLETDSAVDWIHFETPQPGYIQVWIDSPISVPVTELERLRELAETARPAGTILTVQQAARQDLNLDIMLRLSINSDQSSVIQEITDLSQSYIVALPLGGTFVPEDLLISIQRVSGVLEAELNAPTAAVSAPPQTVLRINNLVICTELQ